MKGGYVNVDCSGLDLNKGNNEEQTITGLYNNVKNALKTNKPIFAYNCVWGNDGIVSPLPVYVIDFGTQFFCSFATLRIIVDNKDKVSIVDLVYVGA